MPTWRSLLAAWPHARLRAAEDAVGLPPGQMGNSEVGHLNLGAGRPVLQDLPRIDAAIADGSFFERPALLACLREGAAARRSVSTSSASSGRAASTPTIASSSRWSSSPSGRASRRSASTRCSTVGTRRRDPPSPSSRTWSERLAIVHPDARIATVGGRYYAMDRDQRWERIARGYEAIVHGVGDRAPSATAAIDAGYARGENDEFVAPTVIDGVDGLVRDGDAIIHANFRADRARQLIHALVDEDFDGFDREAVRPRPQDVLVVTMTEYEAGLPVEVAFPPEEVRSLAHAASRRRVAPVPRGRDREVRPRHVLLQRRPGDASAGRGSAADPEPQGGDLRPRQPAMSAPGVADALVEAIDSDAYDFIVANFANPDMVGHTGDLGGDCRGHSGSSTPASPGSRAPLAAIDARDPGGPGSLLIVTADHGNAEVMRDADGRPVTAHSLNPVPIVAVGRAVAGRALHDGVLADVAPTICRARRAGAVGRDDRCVAPRSGPGDRRRDTRRDRPRGRVMIPSAASVSGGLPAWIRSWRSARSSSASP